jgi:hypothetical protein
VFGESMVVGLHRVERVLVEGIAGLQLPVDLKQPQQLEIQDRNRHL